MSRDASRVRHRLLTLDVFGNTAAGDKNMFNDYGQSYDRQGFRKDFNPELTLKRNPIRRKIHTN